MHTIILNASQQVLEKVKEEIKNRLFADVDKEDYIEVDGEFDKEWYLEECADYLEEEERYSFYQIVAERLVEKGMLSQESVDEYADLIYDLSYDVLRNILKEV